MWAQGHRAAVVQGYISHTHLVDTDDVGLADHRRRHGGRSTPLPLQRIWLSEHLTNEALTRRAHERARSEARATGCEVVDKPR